MMLRSDSRRPSAAMLVALLALFVALGSGAYAAGVINGKNIKNGSIKGSKLTKDTLTGQQIDESTLGPVPQAIAAASAATAKHADSASQVDKAKEAENAANAAKLGGIAAATYLHGVHVVTAKTATNAETPKTVSAVCPGNEMAIGGGGNNTANTGSVAFDRIQLEAHKFTITEFNLSGVPGPTWAAEAEVTCVTP